MYDAAHVKRPSPQEESINTTPTSGEFNFKSLQKQCYSFAVMSNFILSGLCPTVMSACVHAVIKAQCFVGVEDSKSGWRNSLSCSIISHHKQDKSLDVFSIAAAH